MPASEIVEIEEELDPIAVLKDRAAELHAEALIWDNHVCLPLRRDADFLPEIERFRAAGVDVVTINVGFGDMAWDEHVRMLTHFRAWYGRQPDKYLLVQKSADLRRAKANGKLAILFDIEGFGAIGDDLGLIQTYYELGVRWMLVAYNKSNRAGGGCQDEADPGLSAFGRAALDEMARVGMLPCASHTGYRTARDVLDHARTPVLFSHSNPRALVDHPRNIPDDLMIGCARTGGVVGINGVGVFLGGNDASTEQLIRHIDYAVAKIGAAHVGLSLDYAFDQAEIDAHIRSNPETFPPHLGYKAGIRFVEPEQLPEVTEGLLRRGYRDADVLGILGGNWHRVAASVWR